MDKPPTNIRHVAVIGGSTLNASLYAAADVMPEILINIVDISAEDQVASALRITDGALVVVECVEGVSVQTETVLRQALTERIVPIVTINGLDRVILDPQFGGEEMYQKFLEEIAHVNDIIDTQHVDSMGDVEVGAVKGNVSFSGGTHDWAFTLSTFARMYVTKFGIGEKKMMDHLWGDHFLDRDSKTWYKTDCINGKQLKRAFVEFVIEPIRQVMQAGMNNKRDQLIRLLGSVGVKLSTADLEKSGKALMQVAMQRWLPAGRGLREMMVVHSPSPDRAQNYRVENLYEGLQNDETANAIRNCDPAGPLLVFVSKMVPSADGLSFFAFGRVFSGTVRTRAKVRILGPESKECCVQMAGDMQDFESISAGNAVMLAGINLATNVTVTDSETCGPIRAGESLGEDVSNKDDNDDE
jgi:elongation factor 2